MGFFSRKSTRKKKFQKRGRGKKTPLLPVAMQGFIARRLTDASGFVFVGAGIGLGLALGSYNPKDPSFNTTAQKGVEVSNVMGTAGAYTVDVLLQTLGGATWFFVGAFTVWGGRILMRRPMGRLKSKVPLLCLAVLSGSVALARFSAPEALGIGALGGSAGGLILNGVGGALQNWIGATSFLFVTITASLLSTAAYLSALGISIQGWLGGFANIRYGVAVVVDYVNIAVGRFMAWHGKHSTLPERTAIKPRRRIQLSKDSTPEDLIANDDKGKEDSLSIIPRRRPVVTQRGEIKKSDAAETRQKTLNLRAGGGDDWEMPGLELLDDVPEGVNVGMDDAALEKNADLLHATLNDFGVHGEILKVSPGPIVTLYEMEPAPGTKTSRVIGLSDDIARSMSARSVRVAVVPGKNAIGMELPNAKREMVYLKDLLSTSEYANTKAKVPLVLGKNIAGDPIIADLARMPHLLVAGTTGSGKSVAVNTMILSILYRMTPEQCRFIMIDPKMLELSVYDDIPHLLTPVVTEAHRAVTALKWAVREMEDRYRVMSKTGVRNIDGFNARVKVARDKGEVLTHKIQTGFDTDTGKPVYEEQPIPLNALPYIVVIVDEFADLMLVAGKEVENAVQRLAQMARAAGIHLIMATQRPSVDVITGVVKANFPTRISFQVTSKIDSRTILGEGGAEQLLGMGDMLYMAAGGRLQRVHGPFVSDDEVEKVVAALRAQGQPDYIEGVTIEQEDTSEGGGSGGGNIDELYDKAVNVVLTERKASTSFIQRHLQIGYNRAARIIEQMEKEGVISSANHVGKREILIDHFGT